MFEAFISPLFSSDGLGILLALVTLETVLSADNAVALAALVGEIKPIEQQHRALNWGLVLAFVLRIILLLTATWVMQFWQFEVAGGIYLIWLAGKHFWTYFVNNDPEDSLNSSTPDNCYSAGRIILLIGLTDLAFSLDSVTAAVALSDQIGLVIVGCTLGIITLRFLASLFVRWLTEFSYLADAAYLTILGVGIRLMFDTPLPFMRVDSWFNESTYHKIIAYFIPEVVHKLDKAPVICVREGNKVKYCHKVEILGGLCRVVYDPDHPKPCGATVWVEVDPSITQNTLFANPLVIQSFG